MWPVCRFHIGPASFRSKALFSSSLSLSLPNSPTPLSFLPSFLPSFRSFLTSTTTRRRRPPTRGDSPSPSSIRLVPRHFGGAARGCECHIHRVRGGNRPMGGRAGGIKGADWPGGWLAQERQPRARSPKWESQNKVAPLSLFCNAAGGGGGGGRARSSTLQKRGEEEEVCACAV